MSKTNVMAKSTQLDKVAELRQTSAAVRQMSDRLRQLADELDAGTVKCGEGGGWVARLDDGWDIDIQMTFPVKEAARCRRPNERH